MTHTNSSTCSHLHIETHWHKYCDIQGHTDTPTNRSASMHETPAHTHHTHTHPDPYAHTHSNKPQESPGLSCSCCPPPRGRRCPQENRGLWSHLKLCWVLHDINSHLAAAGSLELGPGRRQAQTLWPLLGEQREALLSTARPLTPTAGSLSGLSSGCCRYVGLGRPGPGKGPSGSAGEGQQLWRLSEGAPGSSLFLSLSGLHRAGPLQTAGLGDSLPSPVVTFPALKKAMGWCLQEPPCKDG